MARTRRRISNRFGVVAVVAAAMLGVLVGVRATRAESAGARIAPAAHAAPTSNTASIDLDEANASAPPVPLASPVPPAGSVSSGGVAGRASGSTSSVVAPGLGSSAEGRANAGSHDSIPLGRARPAGSASTPDAKPGAPDAGWALASLAALGAVIGLILVLRFGLLKLAGRPSAVANSAVLEVLARFAIAPKNHVLVTRIGHRVLVLGDSPHGLTTLANIDNPEEVAAVLQAVAVDKPGSISRGFDQMLEEFNGGYENPAALLRHQGADDDEHRIDRARDSLSTLTARLRSLGSPASPPMGSDGSRPVVQAGGKFSTANKAGGGR